MITSSFSIVRGSCVLMHVHNKYLYEFKAEGSVILSKIKMHFISFLNELLKWKIITAFSLQWTDDDEKGVNEII